MLLPNYQEITTKDSNLVTMKIIKFDKLSVQIYSNVRKSSIEITYLINKGYHRRNIDLYSYLNAINDYLISHPTYKKYKDKVVNIFDFNYIKVLVFEGLKFSSLEFQLIKNKYPNLQRLITQNCTIYKETLIGCLTCDYYDFNSHIISLSSFNGFSGELIYLRKSYIQNMNTNILNLYNICLNLSETNINYEHFFLTTSAPNLRKIEIIGKKYLNTQDLLFISGFYNLELIHIHAIISNYEQLKKLEKLRELRYIYCSDEHELEQIKIKRQQIYNKLLAKNATNNQLKNYLMMQGMLIQNEYQELLEHLYVPRLAKVKWENKITTNDLKNIRDELLYISNMSIEERINISREPKEYNLNDPIYDLYFRHPKSQTEEEILINSRPFQDGGIDYYVQRKKLILTKDLEK